MANEELVVQIKELQKSDPVAKEQWGAFTDAECQGKRDPSKLDASVLEQFLTQFNSGTRLVSEFDKVPALTKSLQRKSASFKNVWAQYCSKNGGGKNDPDFHPPSFHVEFFEYMAKQIEKTSVASSAMMMGGGMAWASPPMKKMKEAGGMGMPMMGGMATTGNPLKDKLVNQIKAYQKSSVEQKQTWWTYADTALAGVRDPARHDVMDLQKFVATYSVPVAAPGAGGCGGGGIAFQTGGNDMQLAQRVKDFQKNGVAQKEQWYSFCGTIKDPARHPAAKLMEFCSTYGA